MTKKIVLGLLLFCFCMVMHAQNVTISPKTGKLIAALTSQNELGFQNGLNSFWRHNQLPLSFLTADERTLTSSGVLAKHACNIGVSSDGKRLTNVCLAGPSYNIFTLPKGYRFTGYKIVFKDNMIGQKIEEYTIMHSGATWMFAETDRNFDLNNAYKKIDINKAQGSSYTIERTSNDMGNTLYFAFSGNNNGNYMAGIEFQSIEVFFTPEGKFTATVQPNRATAKAVSYTEIPFATQKFDFGAIAPHTKDNTRFFYSYNYRDVQDLPAYNILYQQGAVKNGYAGDYAQSKNISSVSDYGTRYYALASDTYYIESPTTVKTEHGEVYPIAYRITGAKFKFKHGTAITYSDPGLQFKGSMMKPYTYGGYQEVSGGINWDGDYSSNDVATWYFDNSNHLYTDYARTRRYLMYRVERWSKGGDPEDVRLYYTLSKNDATTFYKDDKDNIYHEILGKKYYISRRLFKNTNSNTYSPRLEAYENHALKASHAVPYTLKQSGNYKLLIYGKDGKEIVKTIEMNANGNDEYELTGLNNDAVKFQVVTTTPDARAYVSIDLQMEYLNPYVESMDVVCRDVNGASLSQQFSTDDFSVGGDKFNFYVPLDFATENVTLSFENLRSKYGDNTYHDATSTHKGRYSFVHSKYFKSILTADSVDMYGNNHPDLIADTDYKDKISVAVTGNQAFVYNNAAELSNTNGTTTTKYLKQTPFTIINYKEQGGEFKDAVLKDGELEKTFHVFTADETRYNIAPTYATKHRYHAYYQMTVKLEKKDYVPEITAEKIYDTSTYKADESNLYANKPMWGIKLSTRKNPNIGYLTSDQIIKGIKETAQQKGFDPKDILYIDGSILTNIVYSKDKESDAKDGLQLIKELVAPNALVYLPLNMTADKDNFAYKTISETFRACKNIVLADKQAFFAPYAIQLDAANYATYAREISRADYGTVQTASVILPYALSLNNGVHKNTEEDSQFELYTMQPDNCLSLEHDESQAQEGDLNKAHFIRVMTEYSEANKPYMLKVIKPATNASLSFVAREYGTLVTATPKPTDHVHQGETAQGTTATGSYTFKNNGSYNGNTFMNPKTHQIFYFARNRYLSTKNLNTAALKLYPFRGYYTYTARSSGAKAMMLFGLDFSENASSPTNVQGIGYESRDLDVASGYGKLNITAYRDISTVVLNAAGQIVKPISLRAGETISIDVAAGIYIVNNKKVIVK